MRFVSIPQKLSVTTGDAAEDVAVSVTRPVTGSNTRSVALFAPPFTSVVSRERNPSTSPVSCSRVTVWVFVPICAVVESVVTFHQVFEISA